ncbi:protein of unknown function [Flexibacter flexilis DSM 6793]|uniref:DUF4494 domain-containing protein n=1 Tax=Flexibacter flexilis DSM 6793 TaxID=927664 RepID=A0A1I1KG39_9BACT|nr:DUF4494 domain-containing protein [Flexibacter flexilis]SFC59789.1 protein of unknown function [Flexibacter flexilis DSM 6793]
MALWFSCKVKYAIQQENGKQLMKSEQYLVDALSFTEAEARLYTELGSTIPEFMLASVSKMNLADIFHYDDAETWYKCKVVYVSVDEKTGKEKKVPNVMLVNAHSVKEAHERIEESLSTMIVPFEITDINLTAIIEIFPYVADEKPTVQSKITEEDEGLKASIPSAVSAFENEATQAPENS